ncbi:MAG: haloalkane dehalogenase [Actinomycetota bacterium]|jgi:haloalkane dehalogenase|nr:haloalkane dehalogenase [Actinomycetota bacterium]MEC8464784.1 haloalkane dehalogenase [Actinomycetota bacterium]
MQVVRTPDERFEALPDFPFAPHYVEIDDAEGGRLRVHYVDEGPRDGHTVLLLHGEPSWCFLYRRIIPQLVDGGCRVIAPDLVGFGKSDKPTEKSDYTYNRHVNWMQAAIIDHLDISDATFFGQDWGGLIGLRLVAENASRFARVVISNTGLPTGDHPLTEAFMAWQRYSKTSPDFEIGRIINAATVRELSADEIAAYDAPFPDDSYKAGARIFPSLVPTAPDDPTASANRAAWEIFQRWEKPFLCCFSDRDPVSRGGDGAFLSRVPGTAGQPHETIENAHHFVQEDSPNDLARIILQAIAQDS